MNMQSRGLDVNAQRPSLRDQGIPLMDTLGLYQQTSLVISGLQTYSSEWVLCSLGSGNSLIPRKQPTKFLNPTMVARDREHVTVTLSFSHLRFSSIPLCFDITSLPFHLPC
jgi:hypothetical protein